MKTKTEVFIDGSYGEGGGQILRSALALSLLTGKPLNIGKIRANRPRPGLRAQHLKAVEAAATVGSAMVEGAALNSTSLRFTPGTVQAGNYNFDIGTAGSTSLVLQTLYLPLSFAPAASALSIRGGTHVPWSPSFHYLKLQWIPALKKMGLAVELEMERAGFYPKGDGLIHARIAPVHKIHPLQLTERGPLKRIRGISAVANLYWSIAERQQRQALERLKKLDTEVKIEILALPSRFQGTMLLLLGEFQHTQCCFYALGARGKRAEQVADEVVDALEAFLSGPGAVDPFLADQLLLPMALAEGPSQISTSKITTHLLTNAWLIRHFLPVTVGVEGAMGEAGRVRVAGANPSLVEQST